MIVYYINSTEFFKTHNTDFLRAYADKYEIKSEKRFKEHALGRYLVKTVAQDFLGIVDATIIIKNNKPQFVNSAIKFSISHSGEYVVAAFDNIECGIDVEQMKSRNLEAFSKHYKKDFYTLKDFYKFWTKYEAEIKLAQPVKASYTKVFQDDYMLTVVSAGKNAKPEAFQVLH